MLFLKDYNSNFVEMGKPLKLRGEWAEVKVDPSKLRICREGIYTLSGGGDDTAKEALDCEGRWLGWLEVTGR